MSALIQELRNVQNPALGSVLLWRFVCGYTDHHRTSDHPPLPLLFIVLPLTFHRETFEVLKSTNRPTGLHGFADKFSRSEFAKSDVLLEIHSRALSLRALTWESIQFGVRLRLITMASSEGTVIPVSRTSPRTIAESIKPMVKNSEKLGEWCSELSMFEIGTILKVGF